MPNTARVREEQTLMPIAIIEAVILAAYIWLEINFSILLAISIIVRYRRR